MGTEPVGLILSLGLLFCPKSLVGCSPDRPALLPLALIYLSPVHVSQSLLRPRLGSDFLGHWTLLGTLLPYSLSAPLLGTKYHYHHHLNKKWSDPGTRHGCSIR